MIMEPSAAIQELKAMRDKNPDRKGDTLIDLEKRDFDNYEHLLSFTHEEGFARMRDAMMFIGKAQAKALKTLGIDIDRIMLEVGIKYPRLAMTSRDAINKVGEIADKQIKEAGVVVEIRRYEDAEDKWKDGVYILKHGEIAFYVGFPGPATIETLSRKWVLRSNISLEDDKKIFHIVGLS
jgi:hypothetical protein